MVPASLKELRTSVNLSQPRKATLMDCKQMEIILLSLSLLLSNFIIINYYYHYYYYYYYHHHHHHHCRNSKDTQ